MKTKINNFIKNNQKEILKKLRGSFDLDSYLTSGKLKSKTTYDLSREYCNSSILNMSNDDILDNFSEHLNDFINDEIWNHILSGDSKMYSLYELLNNEEIYFIEKSNVIEIINKLQFNYNLDFDNSNNESIIICGISTFKKLIEALSENTLLSSFNYKYSELKLKIQNSSTTILGLKGLNDCGRIFIYNKKDLVYDLELTNLSVRNSTHNTIIELKAHLGFNIGGCLFSSFEGSLPVYNAN